ncbi:MAG TPA: NlpC/P60 family protein [Acidimicrobiales bacterium]|nr:NlpC/P60 family protein [Acidimicrobiales bacterium]
MNRRPVVALALALGVLLSVALLPSPAPAQTIPPIVPQPGESSTTSTTTATTRPSPPSAPSSSTTTRRPTTTTTPGNQPPVPKIVRQPVADPVFDQGVMVDRLHALLIQAQLTLATSNQSVVQAQGVLDKANAALAKAGNVSRAADRRVAHWRTVLARLAIRSYVSDDDMSFEGKLEGDPTPTYRSLTVGEARRQFASAEDNAHARHQRAGAARRDRDRARDALQKVQQSQQDVNHKITSLFDQLGVAQTKLSQLAIGDKAISPEQAQRLLAEALARRGLDGYGTAPLLDPRVQSAIQFARDQMGKPYQWGGNGPNSFDCSGLTQQAFLHAGTAIPRVAADQQAYTVPVSPADAQPGDLVFFGTPATHVGLYIGDGYMIDAPYTGTVVRLDPVYRRSISGFGRVVF